MPQPGYDLQRAASEYARLPLYKITVKARAPITHQALEDAFIAGAQWGRQRPRDDNVVILRPAPEKSAHAPWWWRLRRAVAGWLIQDAPPGAD